MKKSLLAVAAMTAFAGAAQAQSSVTVFGILDVGYVGGQSTVNSNAITATNGQTKSTYSQFTQSAEQTSRLGFKGTEDLGGGSQAVFMAEFYLYPQDQTLSGNSTTATNNGAGLINRQAYVGLHKNGLGQATVGLQYTPVFNVGAVTDPNQNNNMLGSVTYNANTGANVTDGGTATWQAAYTNRVANAMSLKSDNFSGFTGSAMVTQNNKNVSETTSNTGVVTGGNTNASGWGLGADYTWNKLYVAAAYQALKQITSALNTTVTGANPWIGAQAGGATAGTGIATTSALDIQDNQTIVGATYDFGILKAYAQYVSRKATATANSGYFLKRSGEQVGVRSYITPVIEAWASAGLGRYTAYGPNNPTANFNAWQLGSNYYLSKRTNLYAIYGQQINTTAAVGTAYGSANANNYAIGVRHTF